MSVIETLLGVDPSLFARGTVVFGAPLGAVAAALGLGAIVVFAALGYRGLGPGARGAVTALRVALVSVLVIALARPALIVSEPAASSGVIAVLVDDSRSMSIADVDGAARREAAVATLGPGSTVSADLGRRFAVRHLAVAGSRIGPLAASPSGAAAHTDLAASLDAARLALGSAPVSALVLVSDGADASAPGRLEQTVTALRAAAIPVYTVGVGAAVPELDVEVRFDALPARAIAGDLVEAVVQISHAGPRPRALIMRIEDDGAIVAESPVELSVDGSAARIGARFRLDAAGSRRIRASVAPLGDEPLLANNEDVRTIEVSGDPARVLHFEGEPRFEVKFLRRALADDARLEAVSLVRTAENKFYRLGVRSAEELADGFPSTAEALFVYDALVIGSVEAALLTPAQQALVAQFVARRGGGLVALGGRHALAEGGLGRAAIAGMLPVVLGAPSEAFSAAVAMRPTPDGMVHPALESLAGGDWERLPKLTVVNPVRAVKPGATVLLEADTDADGALVGLAVQHYGRGLVAALPVRDTWRWQLHPDVALEDETHERFWRQLLRWAAAPARPRLAIDAEPPASGPGQPVRIRVEALDAAFLPAAGAPPAVEVEDPAGERTPLALEAAPGEPGVYRASLVPVLAGRHDLVARHGAADEAREARLRVEVLPDGHEFHDANLDATLLERIARETGGAYLPLTRAGDLASLVRPPPGAEQVTRRVPLGQSPALLALALALAAAEWMVRRRRRLA